MSRRRHALVVILLAVLITTTRVLPAEPAATHSKEDLVTEIDRIVRTDFLAPAKLDRVGWAEAVQHARAAYEGSADPDARAAAINALLAVLGTSHTHYYPRSDPAYWQLAGIFEPVIQSDCSEDIRPSLPLTVDDIGVYWKHIDGKWFVGGVYAGSPAEQAGLKLGDEILSADRARFSPTAAFAGKANAPVSLDVRRVESDPAIEVTVKPLSSKPHQALLEATQNSWSILNRNDRRIAYIHIWSWTSPAIQQAVRDAITKSNQKGVDAFVLDLRDGWGGADPSYLSLFDPNVPVLEQVDRTGKTWSHDSQIRRPTAILINNGTRSGKEVIAYGAKKHHLATLIGEATSGAVTFGRPFCLHDGALMLLAVSDAYVDGEHIEGVGVKPDIPVPFEIRYANGRDPQLDAALAVLTSK